MPIYIEILAPGDIAIIQTGPHAGSFFWVFSLHGEQVEGERYAQDPTQRTPASEPLANLQIARKGVCLGCGVEGAHEPLHMYDLDTARTTLCGSCVDKARADARELIPVF